MRRVWFWLATTWIAGLASASLVVGQETEKQEKKKSEKAVTVNVDKDNGKIVIIHENGEKQEIDVRGAKSIIVNHSSQSKVVDGKEERKITGRAIVIDDEGNKREIDLSDADLHMEGSGKGELELRLPEDLAGRVRSRFQIQPLEGLEGLEGLQWQMGEDLPKFFIGVQCSPLDDEQKAVLELDDESGLFVVAVTEESPAQAAGIAADDVLLFAGETALTSPEVLIQEVQAAGEKQGELTLTVIRSGKEQQIKVKPAERQTGEGQAFGMKLEKMPEELRAQLRELPLLLERVGPGIIRHGDEMAHEAHVQMEEMHKQLKVQMEEMREQMKVQMEEMREHMKLMRKEMEKLNRDK